MKRKINILLSLVKYFKALSIITIILIISITSRSNHLYKNEEIYIEPILNVADNNITLNVGDRHIIDISQNTEIDDIKIKTSNENIKIIEKSKNQYELIALSSGHSDVIFTYGNGQKNTIINIHINSNEPIINYVGDILKIAFNEIGYREKQTNNNLNSKNENSGKNNYTKYGKWYGINPGKWCAMFVSWCSYKGGANKDLINPFASVSIGMDWFKEQGLFKNKNDYKPKAGDIIFFKSDGASHTGLVIASDNKYVYTIEGNTNNKVAKMYYDLNYKKITGYGTPDYPNYYAFDYSSFNYNDATNGQSNSTS